MPTELSMQNKRLVLKDILAKRGITNVQLAKELGLTATTISFIVNGKTLPSLKTLSEIANYLNLTMGELFDDFKTETPDSSINGFVEIDGVIKKISSPDDILDLATYISNMPEPVKQKSHYDTPDVILDTVCQKCGMPVKEREAKHYYNLMVDKGETLPDGCTMVCTHCKTPIITEEKKQPSAAPDAEKN